MYKIYIYICMYRYIFGKMLGGAIEPENIRIVSFASFCCGTDTSTCT